MAKINIPFDGTDYSIDESALATATSQLQSHLSTVMNGTGATINLGGNSYNIDSTKLSTATNAFISHLGTIAGSGAKVVVNGVEYAVDSAKMNSAISDLHTVLGGLHSDDSESSSSGPVQSECGLYFGEIYSATGVMGNTNVAVKTTMVFYEDGRAISQAYIDGTAQAPSEAPAGTFTYGDHEILMGGEVFATISADGTQITSVSDGSVLTLEQGSGSGGGCTQPELNEYAFYYGQKYTWSSSDVYFEDGSRERYENGELLVTSPAGTFAYSVKSISNSDSSNDDQKLNVSDDGLSLIPPDGDCKEYQDGYDNGLDVPVLNEYGFYFEEYYTISTSFILYEDGSAEVYLNGELVTTYPASMFTYGDHVIMVEGETAFTITDNGRTLNDSVYNYVVED